MIARIGTCEGTYVPCPPTGTPTEPPTIPLCFDGTLVKGDSGAIECVATTVTREELSATGGVFSPDLALGGVLLVVLGFVAIRARLSRIGAKK